MQKILVTGANSFTASHLIPFLASQGHEIQGHIRSFGENHLVPKFKNASSFLRPFLVGDLSDPKFTENLTYRPDIIIHLAANSGNANFGISKIYRDNVDAIANLIAFSKRSDCSKIIAMSSVSVHGHVSTSTLCETTGFNNPSVYGFTKRAAELLLQESESDQDIYILRLPSILGYGAKNHWLSSVLEKALSNSPIEFQNPKSKFNNAVYIDDLSSFISHLITMSSRGVHTFPLASTEPIDIGEIVESLVKKVGSVSSLNAEEFARPTFTIDDRLAREKYGYTSRNTRSAVEAFALDALREK